MQCHQVKELLSTYLDGMLMPSQQEQVKEHLHKCRACNSELDFLNYVISLVHRLPRVEPPKGFRADLRKRIINEKIELKSIGSYQNKSAIWKWTGITAMAAGFLLVVGLAVAGIGIPFMNTDNIKPRGSSPLGQQTEKEIIAKEQQAPDIVAGSKISGTSPDENLETSKQSDAEIVAVANDKEQKNNVVKGNTDRTSSLLMAADNNFAQDEVVYQSLREVTANELPGGNGQALSMPSKEMDQLLVEVKVRDRNQAFQEINAILISLGGSHTGYSNGADLAMSIEGNKIEKAISSIGEAGIIVNSRDIAMGNQTESRLKRAPVTEEDLIQNDPVLIKIFLK